MQLPTGPQRAKSKLNPISIALYIVSAILLGTMVFLIFNKRPAPAPPSTADTLVVVPAPVETPPVIIDSTVTEEDGEGEDMPYSDYRVIAAMLNTTAGPLRFGDEIIVDDSRSNESQVIAYIQNPTLYPNATALRLRTEHVIPSYQFEQYRTYFTQPSFAALAAGVKKILLNEHYSESLSYRPSQNTQRSQKSVAYGDFDNDGSRDVAVVMDNTEKQASRLYIFGNNSALDQPYMAYAENFSDIMKVRSFKKGASIYMNTTHFVPAPLDGLVLTGEDIVLVVLYDPKLQKYKTYFQE